MDRYATHLEALVTMALRTTGPMLELGCGDYSTPLLNAFAVQQGRELLVQASDPEWMSRYSTYNHEAVQVEQINWSRWEPPRPRRSTEWEWSFVFLDSEESTADRIRRLPALLTVTPFVVLHDADKAMARPHWQEMSQLWQIETHYFYDPQTVVLRRRA